MKPLYSLKGVIVEGNKRGRLLGYPTANLSIKEQIPEGVYASVVTVNDQQYSAATFIGTSKTFDDPEYKLESYILDFDREIYGEEMSVDLYKYIRGNIKFDSQGLLIEQMQKDVAAIKAFLEKKD